MRRKTRIQKWGSVLMLVLACIQATVHAQQPEQQVLKSQFNAYSQQAIQEKLFVHTDKSFYLPGEICWFKIYNADAFFNRPLGISKLAYLELFDSNNKPVLQSKVALKEGSGNGSLHLPAALGSGKYLLRAYTSWMKNFNAAYYFEKTITVINGRKIYGPPAVPQKTAYDIQFFPEGGNLVNGIESKIAFRAVNQDGMGVACNGTIINDRADTVINFRTLKFGMGQFLLTPEGGRSYKAIITLPDSSRLVQVLPAAYSSGYVMRLAAAENGQLKITVQSPPAFNAPVIYFFAHTRGSVKSVETGILRNGYAAFFIDTNKLGDGISHFTIFDASRKPVCERLFFKKPAQPLGITATMDQPEYEPRKKININVLSAVRDNNAIPADMSVAVYKIDSLVQPDEMDISNYLWLTSDLAGNVESPGYYFTSNDTTAATALDNLLLTQGWRRFRWEDVLQQQKPAFQFLPEYKGHIIRGRVTSNRTGKPAGGIECYLSVAGTRTQVRSDLSDDSGFVQFDMHDFYGNDQVIVQTGNQADSLLHIEIFSPYATQPAAAKPAAFSLPDKNPATLLSQYVSVQVQNSYTGNRLQQMVLPLIDTMPFYKIPDMAYMLDDYVRFTTMEEVLREYVPDVNVRRHDGKFYLPVFDYIRKEFFQTDPLVLLDGVPVFDINKLMNYDPLKIRKLEVVGRMYFYGYLYFGGIVNFITYQGDMPGYELDPRTTVIDYETLQMQREFFSPVYETAGQYASRLPDFRSLLYWSPDIKTSQDGKKSIHFYSSDIPGQFAVVLQGITASGNTGCTTVYFRVKERSALAGRK